MRIYTETPMRPAPPRLSMVIHPDWDAPVPRPPNAAFEAMLAKLAEALRADLVRMLGLWVSGCEPCVINGAGGFPLGLALDGTSEVLVPSSLSSLEACIAAVEPMGLAA